MKTRIQALEKRVRLIKQKLAEIGELRPGMLSKQYNVCGNPSCRCKARPPEKHGPYYQLSWSRRSKSSTRFVRRSELKAVRIQIRNYKRLQSLVDQWIDASIELCEIRRSQTRKQCDNSS